MATRLTKHFTLEEFISSETGSLEGIDNRVFDVDIFYNLQYVAYMLEIIRKRYGRPIRISSGYRCPELNKLVGGSVKSHHLQGLAVDIDQGSKSENGDLFSVISSLKNILPINELINENNLDWIHLSFYKL